MRLPRIWLSMAVRACAVPARADPALELGGEMAPDVLKKARTESPSQ